MRQNYKIFLTSFIIATFVIASGLLLFGTLDATEIEPIDSELWDWDGAECVPRGPKPICPNLNATPPCPRGAADKQGNFNSLQGGKS